MSNLKFMGTKYEIERQFKYYKNRKFNLTVPDMINIKNVSYTNNMNNNAEEMLDLENKITDLELQANKQL